MRHSTAHVMAAAVCRVFKGVQLDIGPDTDDGFYYDFDLPDRLSPDDFSRIEKEMAKIIKEDLPFEKQVMSREDAAKCLSESGQKYKLKRLADIPEGDEITFFKSGEFVDLCRGPHLDSTGQIAAFKLTSVAGSYFKGLETNPMLQRIYGTVAETQEILDEKLRLIEEAKLRDNRKVGKELDLYSISDAVGPGLVHWHPRGARIRCAIEDMWRKRHFAAGYEILFSPHIGRAGLWETSGHLDFYAEGMYSPMDIDGEAYYVKPMNCPFHVTIYKSSMRSYRDLPLRWAELGTVYRYEKSGVLSGMLRVRGFTQDDAHIMCTPDQIVGEVREALRFALKMLKLFGFEEMTAYLSTKPEKSVGEPERWAAATESLKSALEAEGLKYKVDEGGGAFYGPKIDIKIKDCLGREWQLSTIQFDFNLPERFDMSYIGEDGKEHRPYMVHRALLGSLERFFGILIEHYGGAFPIWLAPEQVRVLPITDKQVDFANEIITSLRKGGIRVDADWKSDKLGAKIRRAQTEKVPYMLIVGAKEAEAGLVSVRSRSEGDLGQMPVDEFVKKAVDEATIEE